MNNKHTINVEEVEPNEEVTMEDLNGNVALVTGSSRGIGAGIAKHFAKHGAKVVLHGRDEAALGKIEDEIKNDGGQVMHVRADVTKFGEIEAVRTEIEKKFGKVDVLVANAGGSFTKPAPFEELPEDGWRASIDGNLTATFLTIKSFLPGMKARKAGNIITISSAAARHVTGRSPIPYSAAKAGIETMTQQLAAEVGPSGIRVNCIAPEMILTEKHREAVPPEQQKAIAEYHPLKRLGETLDIAQAALFLASDNSSWITGVILDVAGGAVMV